MSATGDKLRPLLFQLYAGHNVPQEDHIYQPDAESVDYLHDAVEKWEEGDMSLGSLQRFFSENGPEGFDVLSWVQDRVTEGHYHEGALVDKPENDLAEDEDLGPNVVPLR